MMDQKARPLVNFKPPSGAAPSSTLPIVNKSWLFLFLVLNYQTCQWIQCLCICLMLFPGKYASFSDNIWYNMIMVTPSQPAPTCIATSVVKQRIVYNPSLHLRLSSYQPTPSDSWQIRSGMSCQGYCTLLWSSSYLVGAEINVSP